MQTRCRLMSRCWLRLAVSLAIAEAVGSGVANCAYAQITPDDTLGAESSVVTPLAADLPADRIDGGAIRGANLFHSFLEFNVSEGRGAYFTNPTGIENIFSRVTGGSRSEILGTLGVLGNANLFLINPKGIIFGPHAQLNVGGSFLASTASELKFADGSQFSAKNPQSPSLLTLSVPVGLQIDQDAGSIVNQSQFNPQEVTNIFGNPLGLLVQSGTTLALVGGELRLEGGSLTSLGGRIELGSVAGPGLVSLTPTNNGWDLGYENAQNFQDIQLSQQAAVNTSSSTSSGGGGDVQVQGRRVMLAEGSRIISFTVGSQPAGTLTVNASESVELTGTGKYIQGVQLFSTGTLSPSDLRNGFFRHGFFSTNFSTGGAGDILINTPKLIARDGAFVTTSTFGQGQGGNLTVNATDSVELAASALGTGSGSGDAGDAGDLTINTKKFIARDDGLVSTSSLGGGQGGTITVNASKLVELTGSNPILIQGNSLVNTSLISGTLGTGFSGDVRVTTDRLILQNGAQLSATTLGQGKGGDVNVQANSLSLTNGAAIISLSAGQGDAGDILINTSNSLQANNGSILANANQSLGGNIKITAGSIRLYGNSDIRADVSSGAENGGNINLSAKSIIAFDDSDVIAAARDGRGGNIVLNTPAFFGYRYYRDPDANPATVEGNNQVDVNASGAVAGIIALPDVNFLQNSLTELPSNPVDANTLIANSCIARSSQQQGSFIITGAGGLPSRPEDASVSPYPTGRVRPIPKDGVSSHSPATSSNLIRPWKLGDPIVEPQGAYHLANGQLVLSRECR